MFRKTLTELILATLLVLSAVHASAGAIYQDTFGTDTIADYTETGVGAQFTTWTVASGVITPESTVSDSGWSTSVLLTSSDVLTSASHARVEVDFTWNKVYTRIGNAGLVIGDKDAGGYMVRFAGQGSGTANTKFQFSVLPGGTGNPSIQGDDGSLVQDDIGAGTPSTAGTYHITMDIDRTQDFDPTAAGKQIKLDVSVSGAGGFLVSESYIRNDLAGSDQVGFRRRKGANITAGDWTFDNLAVTAVPEPTSLMLAASGLGLLLARRKA